MCPRLRVGDSGQGVFECVVFRVCVALRSAGDLGGVWREAAATGG